MWMETPAPPPDLAGVFAFFPNAGTHHGVCDVARIGVLTLFVLNDGDVGASQGVGQVHCGNGRKGCGKRELPVPLPVLRSLLWAQGPRFAPTPHPHVPSFLLGADSSLCTGKAIE